MPKLVDWSPDYEYEKIKSNKTIDEQTRVFMKFCNNKFGIKFIDIETGMEIKFDEGKPNT